MEVKEALYKIIDEVQDEEVLKSYLRLISSISSPANSSLYNSLTDDQKAELNLSYDESFSESNLIKHDIVKNVHQKWL